MLHSEICFIIIPKSRFAWSFSDMYSGHISLLFSILFIYLFTFTKLFLMTCYRHFLFQHAHNFSMPLEPLQKQNSSVPYRFNLRHSNHSLGTWLVGLTSSRYSLGSVWVYRRQGDEQGQELKRVPQGPLTVDLKFQSPAPKCATVTARSGALAKENQGRKGIS